MFVHGASCPAVRRDIFDEFIAGTFPAATDMLPASYFVDASLQRELESLVASGFLLADLAWSLAIDNASLPQVGRCFELPHRDGKRPKGRTDVRLELRSDG
jgi:hypothetical protein